MAMLLDLWNTVVDVSEERCLIGELLQEFRGQDSPLHQMVVVCCSNQPVVLELVVSHSEVRCYKFASNCLIEAALVSK